MPKVKIETNKIYSFDKENITNIQVNHIYFVQGKEIDVSEIVIVTENCFISFYPNDSGFYLTSNKEWFIKNHIFLKDITDELEISYVEE